MMPWPLDSERLFWYNERRTNVLTGAGHGSAKSSQALPIRLAELLRGQRMASPFVAQESTRVVNRHALVR